MKNGTSKLSGTKTKPAGAHLKHGRCQVNSCKDGCQCGVATLHQVDSVEEDEVTRNN